MSTSGKNDERRSISTSASNMAHPFIHSTKSITMYCRSPMSSIAVIKRTRECAVLSQTRAFISRAALSLLIVVLFLEGEKADAV